LAPIHVLGVRDALTARNLAWAALFTFTVAFAAGFYRTDRGEHVQDILDELTSVAFLPLDALSRAFRARSLVVLVLVYAIGLWVWTAQLSFLHPSEGWDGIWYHESMVGFAIQNHGYAPVDMPDGLMQQANGYPRDCEMTNLWFVIFTDRTFIEIVNNV